MQRKEHLTVAGRNKAKVVRDPPPFQSQNVVKGGGGLWNNDARTRVITSQF